MTQVIRWTDDVMKYKSLHTIMPQALIDFNNRDDIPVKIISDTRTDILVRNRKKIAATDDDQKKEVGDKAIRCAINCALNKLSNENVMSVKDELLSVRAHSSPEYVSVLAMTIIQRASNEKNFVEIYARMCGQLAPLKCTDGTFFSKFIAIQSRDMFNKYTTDRTDADRATVINFIKFIGWLYKYDILQIDVIDICIKSVSEHIMSLEYGAEILTSILDIVDRKYFVVCSREKIIAIRNRFKTLLEIETLCKRDKILLQLSIERLEKRIG